MAHERPSILKIFATRYRESQAGRTGVAGKDFTMDYRELLKAAKVEEAEARIIAEDQLRQAAWQSQGRLLLDTYPRDERLILLVRLVREEGEAWLFDHLGEQSPTQRRKQMADVFISFQNDTLAPIWQEAWSARCLELAELALAGGSISPFERSDLEFNSELMHLTIRLLNWQGESLIRFASCTICGDSKRLEQIQSKLENCLQQITGGRVRSFEDIGLIEKPRQVIVRGPLRLALPGGTLDIGLLHGPVAISETDLRLATSIHCSATQVLTVENETTFLELAKLPADTLLIQTSYPGRAVLTLMECLPTNLPIWHFGDTDPAGFDILRDLRARSRLHIQPLHMRFRPQADSGALSRQDLQILDRLLTDPLMVDCYIELKAMRESGLRGSFEQESLGRPQIPRWPYYLA